MTTPSSQMRDKLRTGTQTFEFSAISCREIGDECRKKRGEMLPWAS